MKRYTWFRDDGMQEEQEGEYVLFDDSKKEIERLRAALTLIRNEACHHPRSSWTAGRALEGKDFENYGKVPK